ncbi:MAG: serine hydrolase domain-containing protein [Ginsengibacter sp.]
MKFYQLNRFFFIASFMAILFSCQAQSNLSKGKTQEKKRLETIVDSLVSPLIRNSKIAGMAVGVMRNDSILLLKSYGYADLEFNVRLPITASLEIGSMTKQFTAVAIMQLEEKGLLKLDDNISNYLTINLKNENVTIRQLLSHTSGISEPRLGDIIYHTYPRDTLLRLLEKGSFDFQPGTAMMYNNTGYKLLGLIIEKVTGQTYEEYLIKNIFLKAGMTNTYISNLETIRKNRAHGYNNVNKDGKLTRAEQPYFYWTFSAGALSSTIEDLLKWNQVLHRSELLLKKETYKELINPGFLNDGTQLRYAKGLQVLKYKDYNVIGHGGSGSGILCDSRYFPEQNLTIITLQNTYRQASESEITYSIANNLLPLKKISEKKYEGDLSIYKGIYKGLLDITVDVVDSKLIIKRSWQTTGDTLAYIGNQKWSLGDDQYSFKTENGKIKEMHWDAISAYIILTKVN